MIKITATWLYTGFSVVDATERKKKSNLFVRRYYS